MMFYEISLKRERKNPIEESRMLEEVKNLFEEGKKKNLIKWSTNQELLETD